MSPDPFWKSHYSFAEVARQLGGTRQNWKQRADRGSCPWDEDELGKRGVPVWWVQETLDLREKRDGVASDKGYNQ